MGNLDQAVGVSSTERSTPEWLSGNIDMSLSRNQPQQHNRKVNPMQHPCWISGNNFPVLQQFVEKALKFGEKQLPFHCLTSHSRRYALNEV